MNGEKSLINHVIKSLVEKKHLVIIACEGSKNMIKDDNELLNNTETFQKIIADKIKNAVK